MAVNRKPQNYFTTLLLLAVTGCTSVTPTDKERSDDQSQRIEIIADGKRKTADPSPVITSTYIAPYFTLSYLSEADGIHLTIGAYMPKLAPGSYQVYHCKSASDCNESFPDHNQTAIFGPYPKDPMPPVSTARFAYVAPELGLSPLTLTITSITDEQRAGVPYPTKRVKGTCSGNLAYVEQEQGGYRYRVVKSTQLKAGFDVLTTLR